MRKADGNRLGLSVISGKEHVTKLTCGQCGRPCLSREGFLSYLRSYQRRVSSAKHEKVSSVHTTHQNSICLMPYSNICNICGKVCKSVGGMKRHQKVHTFNTFTYPSIPNLFMYVAIVRKFASSLWV